MKGIRLFCFSLALSSAVLVSAGHARGATKISQSPLKIAWFTYCTTPICVPVPYTWQGLAVVNYDYSYDSRTRTNVVTIKSIDESVIMYGANGTNQLCSPQMGISTDVYQNGGSYFGTLYVQKSGSYIYSPTNLVWGGLAYPNWRVSNPRLTARARAASYKCLGGGNFSWDIYLP